MAALSTADTEFLRQMIAHHQSAIAMSRDYLAQPATTRRADVSDAARAIVTAQTSEVAKFTGWLKAAGQPGKPTSKTMS